MGSAALAGREGTAWLLPAPPAVELKTHKYAPSEPAGRRERALTQLTGHHGALYLAPLGPIHPNKRKLRKKTTHVEGRQRTFAADPGRSAGTLSSSAQMHRAGSSTAQTPRAELAAGPSAAPTAVNDSATAAAARTDSPVVGAATRLFALSCPVSPWILRSTMQTWEDTRTSGSIRRERVAAAAS